MCQWYSSSGAVVPSSTSSQSALTRAWRAWRRFFAPCWKEMAVAAPMAIMAARPISTMMTG
ncbi:hypothetical protein D3C72_2266310 [compost metagenome]